MQFEDLRLEANEHTARIDVLAESTDEFLRITAGLLSFIGDKTSKKVSITGAEYRIFVRKLQASPTRLSSKLYRPNGASEQDIDRQPPSEDMSQTRKAKR